MRQCFGFVRVQSAREILLTPLRLFAAIVFCGLSLSAVRAQGNPTNSQGKESQRAAQVRTLNNSVLQLHGQMQENASGAAAVRGQAATVLAQRAAALQTLMQEDAHAALTFAFSPELLADLAEKFPSSAGSLESHVTLSGTLEHWIADSADLRSSKASWFLNSGGSRLELHFATPQRPLPNSGPTVTVEGVQLGSQVAVSKVSSSPIGGAAAAIPQGLGLQNNQRPVVLALLLVGLILAAARKLRVRIARPDTSALLRQIAVCAVALLVVVCNPLDTSAQNACSTTGVQHIAIIVVNIGGYTFSVSNTDLQNSFFGSGHSLTGYWQENSYGQTSATGDFFGPYTLSSSYTCSNASQLVDDAITAAITNGGLNTSSYTRYFIFAPQGPFSSCGWVDGATVGCYSYTASTGPYTASKTILTDYHFDSPDHIVWYLIHEGGHNLGAMHSGTIQDWSGSPASALGPLSSPGAINEWNDFFSAMGASFDLAQYNAEHKADVGWLANETNYQTVTASGTYTLEPLATNSPGFKALKVLRGTGNSGYYLWVEYRQPVGYDTYVQGFMNYNGALIHYQDPTSSTVGPTGTATKVMDFTQSDVGLWYNTVLGPGQTWTDPYSDVSISVSSATSTGLTVNVSYSGASSSCISSAPTVSVSPLDPSIYAGQSASYTVSITNNDSSACGSSTLSLASSTPSGWTTNFSSSSLSLSPGQSASVTMAKGAPSATPAGTYAVNLTALGNASSGTGTANATVMTAPSLAVTVAVSGTSFTTPGTVPITATVLSGGLPAAGASVTFTVTTPNGSKTSQSVTTGSDGVATWSYKLSGKSPAGTYSVVAQASLGSGGKKTTSPAQTAAVSSNRATFSVQ